MVDCYLTLQKGRGNYLSKFKFSLNGGDLVFWFAFNHAVHLRPKWQWRLKFPVLRRTYLLSTPAFNRLDTHVRYLGIALVTHFSSSSRVLEGLIPHSAICFAK